MDAPTTSDGTRTTTEEAPGDEAVRAALDRLLGSADFAQSERMQAFLRFVVEETLAGRAEQLKEYTIATEVFGRDESFDPRTSTVVRVEAGRLRRRIERYYLTDGRSDAVRIDLPKGAYVPLFRRLAGTAEAEPAAAPRENGAASAGSPDPAAQLPTGPAIAVLPFENLSDDPGQAFFADGITEEINNDLTRFPALRVISRHSTRKYKGNPVDVRDVGRDLGVRYVLEGSVRKAGETIRVTGKLTDAADGTQLFSETYDRDLSAETVLVIQDDITDRIVAAVGQPYGILARSDARQARSKPAEHLDAYEAVLHFYEYWFSYSPELLPRVRTALERAVSVEPGYASAWAGLAVLRLDDVRFGFNPRLASEPLQQALEAAQRAVRLDPENSMAYHALFSTHFHRGELDEFKATGDRAVTLNPNHADMLADFGIMLAFSGDWERGVALADKAIALSPTHPGWFHAARVVDHYRQGAYEAALAKAKLIQMPDFFFGYAMIAMCCGQLGLDREGRRACDRLLELAPEFPDKIWDSLGAWNLPHEIIEQVAEGLRKAGLPVPDRPA